MCCRDESNEWIALPKTDRYQDLGSAVHVLLILSSSANSPAFAKNLACHVLVADVVFLNIAVVGFGKKKGPNSQ